MRLLEIISKQKQAFRKSGSKFLPIFGQTLNNNKIKKEEKKKTDRCIECTSSCTYGCDRFCAKGCDVSCADDCSRDCDSTVLMY